MKRVGMDRQIAFGILCESILNPSCEVITFDADLGERGACYRAILFCHTTLEPWKRPKYLRHIARSHGFVVPRHLRAVLKRKIQEQDEEYQRREIERDRNQKMGEEEYEDLL
jgi:hypothetical protein